MPLVALKAKIYQGSRLSPNKKYLGEHLGSGGEPFTKGASP